MSLTEDSSSEPSGSRAMVSTALWRAYTPGLGSGVARPPGPEPLGGHLPLGLAALETFPVGQHHRAESGGDQQCAGHLERPQVPGEDQRRQSLDVAAGHCACVGQPAHRPIRWWRRCRYRRSAGCRIRARPGWPQPVVPEWFPPVTPRSPPRSASARTETASSPRRCRRRPARHRGTTRPGPRRPSPARSSSSPGRSPSTPPSARRPRRWRRRRRSRRGSRRRRLRPSTCRRVPRRPSG